MERLPSQGTMLGILNRGFAKVEHMADRLAEFPHITQNGKWLTHANGHWTGGFWTGLLWLKSMYGKNPEADTARAIAWAKKLKVRMKDNKTHDMGFIFGPSCLLGYRLTGDEEFIEMAAAGSRNMKDLYEDRSGLVLAWEEPGYEGIAIVDTIMNLPLLVWISEQTHDPDLRKLACHIAENIARHHIREDNSTYHKVRWDPQTFGMVERGTHQGYSPESCWSRGQAWALYGYANMYRYTSEEAFLHTSEQLATYFWRHLDDETKLPKWDFFFQNDPKEPIDAAAASIAASGILLLSDQWARKGEAERAGLWEERGHSLIQALADHCFYQDMERYGIIEKATVDKPRNSGVGESAMYGDYYFMEAVHRWLNRKNKEQLDLLY